MSNVVINSSKMAIIGMNKQIQYMEEKNGPNYSALSHKALLLLHIMVIDGGIVMRVAHPPKYPLAQLLGATMPTQGTWIELFSLGLVGVGRREHVDNPRQILAVLGIMAVLEFLKGGRRLGGLRGRRRLVIARDCVCLGRGLCLAVIRVVSVDDSRVTTALHKMERQEVSKIVGGERVRCKGAGVSAGRGRLGEGGVNVP
jgi:hypothetical protein